MDAMRAGYDFETLIKLERWQHALLAEGLPFEEACKPNPNMTPLHSVVMSEELQLFEYKTIRSLTGEQLLQVLAKPYAEQPQQVQSDRPHSEPLLLSRAAQEATSTSSSSSSSSSSSRRSLAAESDSDDEALGLEKKADRERNLRQ